jgi:hypothetical protein
MRNIRLFLIGLAIVTILAGGIGLAFRLYKRFNAHTESPFNAIPGNTAIIIQLNQAGNLLADLNRSNLIWKSASRYPGIITVRNELRYLDSASRKSEQINQIFRQYKVWIAVTLSGRSTFGALYLASVGNLESESGILDFIRTLGQDSVIITSSPYSTTTLYRAQSKRGGSPFYFSVMKGVFSGSYHANLVKRSLDRLSLNTPVASPLGFKKVLSTVGQKADANIFINYRFFSLVLSAIASEEMFADLIRFSGFADWSGLDLIIKKDELLFNGITVASDSNQQFLSLFTDQDPQKMTISSVIPYNASYFTAYAWSDPERYVTRYQSRVMGPESSTNDQNIVAAIADRYSLNINEYFLPWIGREAAVFGFELPATSKECSIAALSVLDSAKALNSLKALSDSLGIKSESVTYRGYSILKSSLPPFVSALFGDLFSKVRGTHFIVMNNFLLTTDNPEGLHVVIDNLLNENTLSKRKQYLDFTTNLPDQYNIYSYYNTRIAIGSIRKLLNQSMYQQLNPMLDSLRKIESVAFHFSNTDGLFYTNFFLRYNPNTDSDGPLLWQTAMDTNILVPPSIIRLNRSDEKVVVLADENQKLYMVDKEGLILWKLPIMGKILGGIHPVWMPGHDSVFLLFNTETHLYLLKADGNYADKFPMRFPLNATNGLTLIGKKDDGPPEILVAFQDHALYRFGLDGISDRDWKRPLLGEKITQPALSLHAGNRNYIAIVGQSGRTYIANQTGARAITLNPGYLNSPYAAIYPNKTNKKGVLITSDPSGKIVFIRENGQTSSVTLNIFTPEHRFFYSDITGNGTPEFIFSDRNQIFYYSRNYKLVYSYAFRREINNEPFLLNGIRGKSMMGFVVPETNELFLFDQHGYHELESGIRGNSAFDIGLFPGQKNPTLVVGAGKQLRAYRLPKL